MSKYEHMKIFTFVSLTACLLTLGASAQQNSQQKVKITNLEEKSGTLYIGWYKNAKTFMKPGKTVLMKAVKVNGQSEVEVTFDKVPLGRYAISVFLDENGNEDLDTNLVGIPSEKYGFSNNVLPIMRPARFDEAVFEVKGETKVIDVKMK